MSNAAIPLIYAAVALISIWEIARGLATGVMRFGIGVINVQSERNTDRRGFWLYGLSNAATAIAVVYLLVRQMSAH